MTDTPVTDTSLEALKKRIPRLKRDRKETAAMIDTARYAFGWNDAIDHIAELIRTGRIRLETPAQKETDDE